MSNPKVGEVWRDYCCEGFGFEILYVGDGSALGGCYNPDCPHKTDTVGWGSVLDITPDWLPGLFGIPFPDWLVERVWDWWFPFSVEWPWWVALWPEHVAEERNETTTR